MPVQEKTQDAGKKIITTGGEPVTESRGIVQGEHDKSSHKGIDRPHKKKPEKASPEKTAPKDTFKEFTGEFQSSSFVI
jgi:hypothetical protein